MFRSVLVEAASSEHPRFGRLRLSCKVKMIKVCEIAELALDPADMTKHKTCRRVDEARMKLAAVPFGCICFKLTVIIGP